MLPYKPTAISGSDKAFDVFKEIFARADREEFWCMGLNAKNTPLFLNRVAVGSLTASIVHPREVFKPLIIGNAASVIVAHNHPSGNVDPSSEDKRLTSLIQEAGDVIGIKLLDHIILGNDSYFSFADEGLLGAGNLLDHPPKPNKRRRMILGGRANKKKVQPAH